MAERVVEGVVGEDVDDGRERGDDRLDEEVRGQTDGDGAVRARDVAEHRAPQHGPGEEEATSVTARHHGDDAWAATAGVRSVPTATDVNVDHGHHRAGEHLETGVDRSGPGEQRPGAGPAWRAEAAARPPG